MTKQELSTLKPGDEVVFVTPMAESKPMRVVRVEFFSWHDTTEPGGFILVKAEPQGPEISFNHLKLKPYH